MRTLLLAVLIGFGAASAGCKGFPAPLNPAPAEAGKKHCQSGADCASGVCGSDGRCL